MHKSLFQKLALRAFKKLHIVAPDLISSSHLDYQIPLEKHLYEYRELLFEIEHQTQFFTKIAPHWSKKHALLHDDFLEYLLENKGAEPLKIQQYSSRPKPPFLQKSGCSVVPEPIESSEQLEQSQQQENMKINALNRLAFQDLDNPALKRIPKALGSLLSLIANIAITIRMNSAYCRGSLTNPNTPTNIMFLSDMLHNLHFLGRAIEEDDICRLHIEIDKQIGYWEMHKEDIERARLDSYGSESWSTVSAIEVLITLKNEIDSHGE